MGRKIKLNTYLKAYTKINSRWIRWLNNTNQTRERKQSKSNRICQSAKERMAVQLGTDGITWKIKMAELATENIKPSGSRHAAQQSRHLQSAAEYLGSVSSSGCSLQVPMQILGGHGDGSPDSIPVTMWETWIEFSDPGCGLSPALATAGIWGNEAVGKRFSLCLFTVLYHRGYILRTGMLR